jgi:hypothetical protein
MTQYLLSIYQPDGDGPPEHIDIEKIERDCRALVAEMKAAGAWVFSGGLHPASTATVVRVRDDGEATVTDGPYIEAKEHIGGCNVIEASDLDAALEWGRKTAVATTLPIEVRPFYADHDDEPGGAGASA